METNINLMVGLRMSMKEYETLNRGAKHKGISLDRYLMEMIRKGMSEGSDGTDGHP